MEVGADDAHEIGASSRCCIIQDAYAGDATSVEMSPEVLRCGKRLPRFDLHAIDTVTDELIHRILQLIMAQNR